MSSMFSAIDTAGSALRVYRTWLDAVSDNVANINTVRPTSEAAYQQRFVVARPVDGDASGRGAGVEVAGIALSSAEGRLVHQPDHPLADADGMVRVPDVDLGEQLVQLMVAQRGYQSNLAVVDRARDTYLAALQIGRS